ncbi:tRNA glutamyl-Q(34) synthetase GluQRS [Scopulibacillus cellulosilyticus]|uniref:Glutamyl-Q tRNA(Asp) synthetase n=1 Tax=Scopulibacillus cellulosilyticus TaxID=2665665 RepID=A0ABW2PYR9_9BACL
MIRGRFAPTPSGDCHIGNARTALLSWLQIRQAGGEFVLRIEDIDQSRCKPSYAEQMIDDLLWLGIDWDEGPGTGGPYAPYEQSKRTIKYQAAFDQLNNNGWLYPCFCRRKDLKALANAPHGLSSEGPAYPGFCRYLTSNERKTKAKEKDPSYRFAMPDKPVAFVDGIMGEQHYAARAGGDFVVRRADGFIGYQLAVVVDDADMHMTDILRGADLLDSTPRQILLYQALEWPVPRFTHVPLLYGPDGRRLSKRHGTAVTLHNIRQAGVKPESVVGILAFISGLIDRPEPVKAKELILEFDLSKIPQSPVVLSHKMLQNLSNS